MRPVKTSRYALIFFTIISLLFNSCKISKSSAPKGNNLNYKSKNGILIGEIPLALIRDNNTNYEWFSKNYNQYKVKKEIISDVRKAITEIKFDVYLGTWCGDTKRMLPKFVKILDFLDYDFSKVRFIALDRQKKGLENINPDLNITNVPTIIFLRDGKEINRIVEQHVISLESDIKNILTVNSYIHSLK